MARYLRYRSRRASSTAIGERRWPAPRTSRRVSPGLARLRIRRRAPAPKPLTKNPFDQFDAEGRSAGDAALDAWIACLVDAVDALVDQPEPARTVTDAAEGSCADYEVAFSDAGSDGLTRGEVERLKTEMIIPKMLAQVMVARAARAKLREKSPSPAIDYNRM
jgi:hypothetical protein